MPTNDWLSTGGSYFLIAAIWATCSIFFGFLGIYAGKAVGRDNDGCLVSIGNVVLTLLGGGLGFLLLIRYYPWFILGSFAGALLLPTIATFAFIRKAKNG